MPNNSLNESSRNCYLGHSWECRHQSAYSEIYAYIDANGKQEVVLTVHPTSGVGHEQMASYLTKLINDAQGNRDVLATAIEALEICLEGDGLNFSSEQAADSALSKIKHRMTNGQKL